MAFIQLVFAWASPKTFPFLFNMMKTERKVFERKACMVTIHRLRSDPPTPVFGSFLFHVTTMFSFRSYFHTTYSYSFFFSTLKIRFCSKLTTLASPWCYAAQFSFWVLLNSIRSTSVRQFRFNNGTALLDYTAYSSDPNSFHFTSGPDLGLCTDYCVSVEFLRASYSSEGVG